MVTIEIESSMHRSALGDVKIVRSIGNVKSGRGYRNCKCKLWQVA